MTADQLIAMLAQAASPSGSIAAITLPFRKQLGAAIQVGADRLLVGVREDIKDIETDRAKHREHQGQDTGALSPAMLEELERLTRDAADRFVREAVAGQINILKIRRLAYIEIQREPPVEKAGSEINDGLLLAFDRVAAGVSEVEVQHLYARLLAGELREPGTFSVSAIDTLARFDAETTGVFERVVAMIGDAPGLCMRPEPGYMNADEAYWDSVSILVDAGVLRPRPRLMSIPLPKGGAARVSFSGHAHIDIVPRFHPGASPPNAQFDFAFEAFGLTRAGEELRHLSQYEPTEEEMREVIGALQYAGNQRRKDWHDFYLSRDPVGPAERPIS